MVNNWAQEDSWGFRYYVEVPIRHDNYKDVINLIDHVFYESLRKDDLFFLSEYRDKEFFPILKFGTLEPYGVRNTVESFRWLNHLIETYNNDYFINELPIVKIYYAFQGRLVLSNLTICEWGELLKTTPNKSGSFLPFMDLSSAFFNLPLAFSCEPISLDEFRNFDTQKLRISIKSQFSLWWPEVEVYGEGRYNDFVDNTEIAIPNSARLNSLFRSIKTKLNPIGIKISISSDFAWNKNLTDEGILIRDKLNYWEDIAHMYENVPHVNFKDEISNLKQEEE